MLALLDAEDEQQAASLSKKAPRAATAARKKPIANRPSRRAAPAGRTALPRAADQTGRCTAAALRRYRLANGLPHCGPACGKSFVSTGNLQRHFKGPCHYNTRRYGCGACSKSFGQASHRDSHRRHCHG